MNKLINDDCLTALTYIPDDSIDCVITSPPYNLGIKYADYDDKRPDYLEWCDQWIGELARVLKEDGSFFLNVGWTTKNFQLPYQLMGVAEKHFNLQNNIIWVKHLKVGDTPMGYYRPSTSNHHLGNTWEHLFHFSKKKAMCDLTSFVGEYNDTRPGGYDVARREKYYGYRMNRQVARKLGYGDTPDARDHPDFERLVKEARANNPFDPVRAKDEGAVWYIQYDSVREVFGSMKHPAVFPTELAERAILMTTQPGDVVLDPFAGSGTTLVAAKGLDREYIGIEMSKEYCDLIRTRM